MKDGTNMDNETKIENDIPDNSTEEKNKRVFYRNEGQIENSTGSQPRQSSFDS